MVTLSLYRNLSHIFTIFGNILLPKVAKNGNFIDLKVAKNGNNWLQIIAKIGNKTYLLVQLYNFWVRHRFSALHVTLLTTQENSFVESIMPDIGWCGLC